MPYINQSDREHLDQSIDKLIETLKSHLSLSKDAQLVPYQLENLLGLINYSFSRIVGNLIGQTSYSKIAMLTGVLENVQQELYRRLASPYEDNKIIENGDIKEYKNLTQGD